MKHLVAALILAASIPAQAREWTELTPWRTWVVLDDVGPLQDWFVVDGVQGLGQACQVGVLRGQSGPGVVACGQAQVGDAGARPVPREVKGAAKRAVNALVEATGLPKGRLKAGLTYLGPLTRVSFRQVVPVEAPTDPAVARSRTVNLSWDVDAETGRVDHGLGSDRPAFLPVCQEGIQVGCETAPRLLPYDPPRSWEGMLAVPGEPGAAEAVGQLEVLVREVAGGARGAPSREVSGGLLPPDHEAGLAVQVHVQAHGPGVEGGGWYVMDVPLNDAAFGPAVASTQVDGVPAKVEVELRIATNELVARIRPARGRYVEQVVPLSCDLVVDGTRAAVQGPCEASWGGQWLDWRQDNGKASVLVQVADAVMPLTAPSRGPGLRVRRPD